DDLDIGEVADVGYGDLNTHARLLQDNTAEVFQQGCQVDVETGRGGAIDHAVIVGQRQRQHQTRLKCLAIPDRLHRGTRHTQDGHFRRIDDGCEVRAADAAQRGN